MCANYTRALKKSGTNSSKKVGFSANVVYNIKNNVSMKGGVPDESCETVDEIAP